MGELSGKKMAVSGKPVEWAKYLSNGEFNCSKCKWKDDSDTCGECWDYGTEFVPEESD